jgi:hypothetical protein
MDTTTNDTTEQPKKKRSGPRSITERMADVRAAGKARLAKLEAKRETKLAELSELDYAIEALTAEIGVHEDDEPQLKLVAAEDNAAVDALAPLGALTPDNAELAFG